MSCSNRRKRAGSIVASDSLVGALEGTFAAGSRIEPFRVPASSRFHALKPTNTNRTKVLATLVTEEMGCEGCCKKLKKESRTIWPEPPINTTSGSLRRPCTRSAGQVMSVCATANNAKPGKVNDTVRSIARSSAADLVTPLASSHCATATAAHKTPCQGRGTKSSSKAARAHSQNTTQFALDNASSNRPHHANGRGNVGAEQTIEAATPIASAAPSSAAVLSRRSRSAKVAISRHNATTAPRNPRSIDIKPLVPTIGNTPNAIVEPRRLAHTPRAQLMSSRQIISKRLRTERSPIRLRS